MHKTGRLTLCRGAVLQVSTALDDFLQPAIEGLTLDFGLNLRYAFLRNPATH